jgi:hypothetical protein
MSMNDLPNSKLIPKIPSQRMLGLWIGALMGFLYTWVAAAINPIVIRDLPLVSDLSVAIGHIILATLAGALMGFIVNWTEDSLPGILVTSLLGAVAFFAMTLMNASQSGGPSVTLIVLFGYTILPMSVLFLPLTALLRWAAGYLLRPDAGPWWHWRSLRVILGLFALAIAVGVLPLYSKEARRSLHIMNDTITLVQTSGPGSSPYGFRSLAEAVSRASRTWSLEWTDDLRRFPYAATGEDSTSTVSTDVVFAYFDSGETIACLIQNNTLIFICSQLR